MYYRVERTNHARVTVTFLHFHGDLRTQSAGADMIIAELNGQ